jgi:hypothetical protein
MPKENPADPENNSDGKAQRNGEAASQRRRFPIPEWLDHFNMHDLKVLFRCWTALWVSSLLMFIGPALHSIGIATFFAALLLYIVPPSSILFIYLLAALSLLFGMCLAWAWGLITTNHGETAAAKGTGGFPGPAIWTKHHLYRGKAYP